MIKYCEKWKGMTYHEVCTPHVVLSTGYDVARALAVTTAGQLQHVPGSLLLLRQEKEIKVCYVYVCDLLCNNMTVLNSLFES